MEKIGYLLSSTLIYNAMFAFAFAIRENKDVYSKMMMVVLLACVVGGIASTIMITSVDDRETNEATIGKEIKIVHAKNITRKEYANDFLLIVMAGLIIFLDANWLYLYLFWGVQILCNIPYADAEHAYTNPTLLILGYNVFRCVGTTAGSEIAEEYYFLTKKFGLSNNMTIKVKNINNHTLRLNETLFSRKETRR